MSFEQQIFHNFVVSINKSHNWIDILLLLGFIQFYSFQPYIQIVNVFDCTHSNVFLMPFGSNNFSVESNGIFLMSAAFFSSFLFSFKCLIDKWNIFDFENNGPILSNRDSDRRKISPKTKHTSLLQLLTIISIVSKSKLLFKYKYLILMRFLRIDFKFPSN